MTELERTEKAIEALQDEVRELTKVVAILGALVVSKSEVTQEDYAAAQKLAALFGFK